jgi:AraC family transcriptional regulator of adaptative response / DNA-3-methyladenine glycosylase II
MKVGTMLPERHICQRARLARDPRFDGRFFVAVVTTGIYCRPVCPARQPAEENVRYYPSPAAAQDAGYRPCLRCRPETARRLPEWTLGSTTVVRALRLIDAGFLDEHGVGDLAARLGISTRHLNRLFAAELEAAPKGLARTRRVQLAKRLIDGSTLPLADVAFLAGFGSVRRFNHEFRTVYGCAPGSLRRRRTVPASAGDIVLHLPVRRPYHEGWMFDFLARRALPGLEVVAGSEYRRALYVDGEAAGWLSVRSVEEGVLRLSVPAAAVGRLSDVLRRVRRVFDLDADPTAVETALGEDPLLASQLARSPGLRVPGAWDGFEIAVRAVLGQQVSVARARDLAVRLCARFGAGDFPTPGALVDADVAAIGMPGKRAEAIRALARAVERDGLVLDEAADPQALQAALVALPGVGPWTAGYIGMRVARDPDAFPDADWVVLKTLGLTARAARQRAAAWRPWRAYAVMLLWRLASEEDATESEEDATARMGASIRSNGTRG